MTVRFNKSVDMASLIAQTNVIVDAEDEANTPITITAGATPSEIVITTTKTVGDLLTFDSDGFFELRLQGSGANPVESVSGQALDGDGDGNPGGEFTHQYVLIGK
jgi:hypothetical protein